MVFFGFGGQLVECRRPTWRILLLPAGGAAVRRRTFHKLLLWEVGPRGLVVVAEGHPVSHPLVRLPRPLACLAVVRHPSGLMIYGRPSTTSGRR